jgi:hypothetical protein
MLMQHREALRRACALNPFDSTQGLCQHVLIKEIVDIAFDQFSRMDPAVKREEASNPVEVGFFGALAAGPTAQSFQ